MTVPDLPVAVTAHDIAFAATGLVTAASGLLAGAVTWSVTQPVLEDEVLHG